MNLRRANLDGANLSDASLEITYFEHASFKGATLQRANLKRAQLMDCNFESADLTGADLSFAHLQGSCLSGALLDGTTLYGSFLVGATVDDVDFSGADLRTSQWSKEVFTTAANQSLQGWSTKPGSSEDVVVLVRSWPRTERLFRSRYQGSRLDEAVALAKHFFYQHQNLPPLRIVTLALSLTQALEA